jgi:hypothetical protein
VLKLQCLFQGVLIMNRLVLAAAAVFLGVVCAAAPAQADRGGRHDGGGLLLGFGLGLACCGYAPYYSPSYYGYPDYYAPPPTVVYTTPPPVTYVAPPAYYAPSAPYVASTQASPVFVDRQGRTCRSFQTSIDGAPVHGTACLQPDGTWRTVDE